MKKRGLALLWAFLLATAAGAVAQDYYTLPEVREQAAGGWHETYTDKYGRELTVDIDLDVYGEDVAPVLRMKWHDPQVLDEEVNSPQATSNELDRKGHPRLYLYESDNPDMDVDTVYAEEYGNTLTYGQFCALVEELKALHGIDKTYLYEQPDFFRMNYTLSKKTEEVLVPAFYIAFFWQTEYGLPIMMDAMMAYQKPGGIGVSPILSAAAKSVDEYEIGGFLLDIDEVLAEDIPLASVDKVIEGAREFIEDGYVYSVEALRFGYAVYCDPQLPYDRPTNVYEVDTWYCVPTWVMYCYIRENPKRDGISQYAAIQRLIINAQTGEMANYFDKSLNGEGDSRYKGFIAWEDVM